jgi:hypothetical protein
VDAAFMLLELAGAAYAASTPYELGMGQAWPVSKRLILPSAMVKAHLVRISPQVSLR